MQLFLYIFLPLAAADFCSFFFRIITIIILFEKCASGGVWVCVCVSVWGSEKDGAL